MPKPLRVSAPPTLTWEDGPDALNVRRPSTRPDTRGNLTRGLAIVQGLDEVARVRKHPELYEAWHIRLVEDARAALAERLDMYDLDCRSCGHAVLVEALDDSCPNCGGLT